MRRQKLFSLSSVVIFSCGMLCQALPALGEEPLPDGVTHAAEATFGNDVAQLTYFTPNPINGVQGALDYGALLATNRQLVGSAALMFRSDLGVFQNFQLDIGPKGYLALLEQTGTEKNDVAAIAVGASARLDLFPPWGVAAFGSFFYSPNVLTFGSANNIYDLTAGAEARLASQVVILGGYRWFKFTLSGELNNRLSNELFVGIRWQFHH